MCIVEIALATRRCAVAAVHITVVRVLVVQKRSVEICCPAYIAVPNHALIATLSNIAVQIWILHTDVRVCAMSVMKK